MRMLGWEWDVQLVEMKDEEDNVIASLLSDNFGIIERKSAVQLKTQNCPTVLSPLLHPFYSKVSYYL